MTQNRKGLLLVISGPAGVGKGTINLSLISRNSDIRMSVSATTRQPRPGEIDGVHYFFKTEEEFQKMIESGAFLEYMRVFNTHYYGTPKSFVEQELAEGRLDVYPRLGPTSEWDTAAGQCILHAAGGNVLSLQTGKPFRYNRRPSLLNGEFIALGDLSLPWRQWLVD